MAEMDETAKRHALGERNSIRIGGRQLGGKDDDAAEHAERQVMREDTRQYGPRDRLLPGRDAYGLCAAHPHEGYCGCCFACIGSLLPG